MPMLNRREFLSRAAWLAAASPSAALAFAAPGFPRPFGQDASGATSTVVGETAFGRIRGVETGGIKIFKGVPYGASTAGPNRFRPAIDPQPWSGVRDALDYGPSTPQTEPSATARPSRIPESEDCLVLNIWTPALNDGGKRPVMFWCHGGGFRSGSASSRLYDGTNLSRRGDVVVVSINHRLNVLGFTHLDDVAGRAFEGSGTAGMTDIVHALEWVRANIERFGGDPSNVTVFGQSGGGRKVGTLLAMPSAKGLFHRAIDESGPTIRLVEREQATRMTVRLLAELGIERSRAASLQTVALDRLMSAYFRASRGMDREQLTAGFAPVVDGRAIPQHPFHPAASAVSAGVPLIIGANRTEMTYQLSSDAEAFALDEAGMQRRVRAFLGERADAVTSVYRRANPGASPSDLFFLMISDFNYCAPIMTIAERRAALRAAPVYAYYFRWETPVDGGRLRTPHALEIPFVFDNITVSPGSTGGGAAALALSDKMSDAWIQFARTGTPDVPKLPHWPRFDAADRWTMVFDNTSRAEHDPLGAVRETMQQAMGLSS
jgi:para-nitrobenzyl esterase